MDEQAGVRRVARRGLMFSLAVPSLLFGSMLVAWEIYVAFSMDLSGLG